MKKKPALITNDMETPASLLASQIFDVSEGMKKLSQTPLSERALVLLIHDACGNRVTKSQIKEVLNALPNLANTYLKKEKRDALR
jgi:hypothetical protein